MTRKPIYFRSASLRRRTMLRLLNGCGLSYSRASTAEDVIGFFRSLWPVNVVGGLVRIGSDRDGGYLIPAGLEPFEALFSAGVAKNADFELEFLQNFSGAKVFMVDGSIEANPILDADLNVEFLRKFLGLSQDGLELAFDSWVRPRYSGRQALLSMDIEGAEYAVLSAASDEVLKRFSCIVLELHGLNLLNSREGCSYLNSLIVRLKRQFAIAHLHANNYADPIMLHGVHIPAVLELTLVNRRCSGVTDEKVPSLPHSLDVPNCQKGYPAYHHEFMDGVLKL